MAMKVDLSKMEPSVDSSQSQKQLKDEPALRFDAGKPRVDLLPVRPLLEIAKVFGWGATKYEDRNWEKGMSYSRAYGSAMRHLYAWWDGETVDPESMIHHLAHAATNIMFLLEYELKRTGKDDRSPRSKVVRMAVDPTKAQTASDYGY